LAPVDAAELEEVGLGWANVLVMRRTHATLMRGLGVDGKLVADQLGHSIVAGESRLAAVNQLEKSLQVM
jgi:integrase